MYATKKPTKRRYFRHAVQLLLMVCLAGVLLLEPVKNTLAYVTSSPVKVVNTFEGETETEPTEPTETTTEPTAEPTESTTEPTETAKPTDTTKTDEPTEIAEPTETATPEESAESPATSGTDETSSGGEEIASPTGDSSNAGFYAFSAVISLAAIILLLSRSGRVRESKGYVE